MELSQRRSRYFFNSPVPLLGISAKLLVLQHDESHHDLRAHLKLRVPTLRSCNPSPIKTMPTEMQIS